MILPDSPKRSIEDGYASIDTIVGITSYGTKQCDSTKPSVYTSIAYFKDWIQSVIDGSYRKVNVCCILSCLQNLFPFFKVIMKEKNTAIISPLPSYLDPVIADTPLSLDNFEYFNDDLSIFSNKELLKVLLLAFQLHANIYLR